jgi:septal ring factor EnvC (AmiA/AmiB activator)
MTDNLSVPCDQCGATAREGDLHTATECFTNLNNAIEQKDDRIAELTAQVARLNNEAADLRANLKSQTEVNEALKRQLRKYQLADTSPASGRG